MAGYRKTAVWAVVTLGLALAGCHKEGPAEKAGKDLDKTGQKIEDAVNPPGPAQKAGRALDNAGQ